MKQLQDLELKTYVWEETEKLSNENNYKISEQMLSYSSYLLILVQAV